MRQVSGQGWKELKDSQDKIEKLSFDCINQHDIVTNQVYELTSCINEIMTKLDETVYTVEDVIQSNQAELIASNGKKKSLETIGNQLNEQMELLIKLSQQFNGMMEQHDGESEIVHEIEGMVEKQRELVDFLLDQS